MDHVADREKRYMKSRLIAVLKLIFLVPVAGLVLSLFLYLCYCVPLNEENFRFSVDELDKEGWYTDVLELRPGYDQNFFSDQPGIQPVYNDMMDYYRAGGYSDKSPLYNAMAMGYDEGEPYPRYWHGYAGILRLLLIWFDCKEIKLLSFMIQFALVVCSAIIIKEHAGSGLTLLFLTQYVLLMPLAVSVSLVFSFSIDISLLGIIIYSRFSKEFQGSGNSLLFFCTIGILTCFFEELVFGVLTWGITVMWVILLFGREKKVRNNLGNVIGSGVSWIWGYGGIWVMKWIISIPVLGESVIENGIEQMMIRSSSSSLEDAEYGIGLLTDRISAISLNYQYYYYPLFFILILIWVLVLSFRLIICRIKYDTRIPALGLISAAPVLWYFILSNHTIGHRFMTYRIMNFGIVSVLALLYICSEGFGSNSSKVLSGIKDNLLFKSIMLVVSVVAALIIVSVQREEYESYNADIPGVDVPVSAFENGIVSLEFHPQHRKLKTLGLSLTPADCSGDYRIRLSYGEDEVYSVTYSMDRFSESPWQTLELDWLVDTDLTYRLDIIPEGASGDGGTVLVCYQDERAGADVDYFSNNPENGRIVYWAVYKGNVIGRKWLFYFVTWFALCESFALVILNVFMKRREAAR